MRVETNTALMKRNRTMTQYLFFVSMGLLTVGFFGTNARFLFPNVDPNLMVFLEFTLPAIILPIAFASTLISVRMTNLWVRVPRPEQLLPENLKGLGNKAVLYNYYHIPARHVLICPQGVFAIVTRFQNGDYSVDGDTWRTKRSIIGRFLALIRMDGVGNPSVDAVLAAEGVQKALAPIAPDVKVQPVVVFVDPRARLSINKPTVPVVFGSSRQSPNLKDYLKGLPKKEPLTPAQIAAFEAATGVSSQKE